MRDYEMPRRQHLGAAMVLACGLIGRWSGRRGADGLGAWVAS